MITVPTRTAPTRTAPVRTAPTGVAPVLLATSHGTSDPAGQRAVLALVEAVAAAAPQLIVWGGYVDVQSPDVPTCLTGIATDPQNAAAGSTSDAAAGRPAGRPVVIVPLLLSAGYHVRVDLAEAAAEASQPVRVTGALGPDPRLARILADRLHELDLRPDDTVVLAAAGSTDANAVADCHTTGAHLAAVLGRPVTVGFISAAEPRLADAVLTARAARTGGAGASGRVVVATYLLAPGYFAGLAASCGADAVSRPLLVDGEAPPRQLVDVVLDLYASTARLEQALAGLPWSFSPRP
jgi:sirohydrochlorin ferrochelatase